MSLAPSQPVSDVGIVDTHAHLMDLAFTNDLEAVLDRARAAGVRAIVCVGYDLASSRAAVQLARTHPGLWAAVGIHPHSASEAGGLTSPTFKELADLACEPKVVAIGETGLDYFRHHSAPEDQRAAFEWHLRLAESLSLPVIVHNRDADGDTQQALIASAARRRASNPPGLLHCFSSSDATYLSELLAAGYYASFAGPVTYKKNQVLRETAGGVPSERLLVETDCPYLTPEPRRGHRNEPAYVAATTACLAAVRGVSLSRLVQQLWVNTGRIFPSVGEESTLGQTQEAG